MPAHWAFVLATILEATLKTSGSIPAMLLSAACALLLMCAVAQADTGKKTSTSAGKSATTTHKATRKGKRVRKTSWRRGQQKIDPKRAREIQEALIREHYMQGNDFTKSHGALPGREWMADEDSPRRSCLDQIGPGSRPRTPAQS